MSESNQIISVEKDNFFPMSVVVIGVILLIASLSVFGLFVYHAVVFDFTKSFSEIAMGFLKKELPIMLLLIVIGLIFILTKRIFEFNPVDKTIRKGARLFQFKFGEWKPFVPQCRRLAFQRYEQTSDYTYGGLYHQKVDEYVYDLRMVKEDDTFESLVSASDFSAVSQILLLGKKISEVYGISFHDYVLELLKKQSIA